MRTALLLGVLTGVFVGVGYLLGGLNGSLMFLVLAALMNFGTYWFSSRIVLAMTKATPLKESESPELHRIVDELAKNAGIPVPRLYVVRNNTPNAFATGRGPKDGVIAVHTGLLDICDTEEVKGVLAHEISHIKNRDTLVSAVAATVAGAVSYLGYAFMYGGGDRRDSGSLGLVAMILAPIAAVLIQMAISRTREYGADKSGARISSAPSSLASALLKIEAAVAQRPMAGNPATSHMYIVNPFRGASFASLFSTHPPTKERVKRLREM